MTVVKKGELPDDLPFKPTKKLPPIDQSGCPDRAVSRWRGERRVFSEQQLARIDSGAIRGGSTREVRVFPVRSGRVRETAGYRGRGEKTPKDRI